MMPDLELVPDRKLLAEIGNRFEECAFIGLRTQLPGKPGEIRVHTSGCLYRLETLCADLRDLVRAERLSGHQIEDWEEDK